MRSAYATVTGTVQQQFPSGLQPVGEATISLTSGNNTYTVATASIPTSAKGRYEITNVVPGTYTLSASSKGTSPTTEIITVTAGQVLTQNIQLIQPASISGTVTLDGVKQAGYLVDLYVSTSYPNTVTATATTGADGTYTFTGVDAPQAYVLSVRSPSSGPLATGTIALQPSQSGTLDFPLKSSTTGAATQAASCEQPCPDNSGDHGCAGGQRHRSDPDDRGQCVPERDHDGGQHLCGRPGMSGGR